MTTLSRRILLAVLALSALAAPLPAADCTYYVCATAGGDFAQPGSDATGTGTLAAPFATLSHALAQHTATTPGSDAITLVVRSGDTLAGDTLILDNAADRHEGFAIIITGDRPGVPWHVTAAAPNAGLLRFAAVTAGSVTLRDLHFEDPNAIALVTYLPDAGMDLTLERVTVILDRTDSTFCSFSADAAATARDLTCRDCSIDTRSHGINVAGPGVNAGALRLENTAITTRNSNAAAVRVLDGARLDNIDILDFSELSSTIVTGFGLLVDHTAAGVGIIRLRDSTFRGNRGIVLRDHIRHLWIDHCIAYGGTGTAADAISLGMDQPDAVQDGFRSARVTDCTAVSYMNTALLIGFGLDGAEVAGNRLEGRSHTFTIYASHCHIFNNIATGCLTLFECGSYNAIHNNTCFARCGTAYLTGTPGSDAYSHWPYPVGSQVYNNIFVQTVSYSVAMWDYEGRGGGIHRGLHDDAMTHYIDYNCYFHRGGGVPVRLGYDGIDCHTIEQVQQVWRTGAADGGPWNEPYALVNDTHSFIADPELVDPMRDDFRFAATSACLNAGRPLLGMPTHIGAWQGVPEPDRLQCGVDYPYPPADVTSDCYVNLADAARLAERWLAVDCGAANAHCGGADLDQDGLVDIGDITLLANDWLDCTDPEGPCGP